MVANTVYAASAEYKQKIKRLQITNVMVQMLYGDMIKVYITLINSYCKKMFNLQLKLYQENITRGHSLKPVNLRCHYDSRKYAFSVKTVDTQNSLPASVISANNVNTFKNRLDRFSANQELMFDYKSTLTGTGNRSFVGHININIFSFETLLLSI